MDLKDALHIKIIILLKKIIEYNCILVVLKIIQIYAKK